MIMEKEEILNKYNSVMELVEQEDKILPYEQCIHEFKYVINRNNNFGNLCGYIHIPPCYKKIVKIHCMDMINETFHGKITYNQKHGNELVLGFDCAHHGDYVPYAVRELLRDGAFITCSLFNGSYKPFSFVKEICERSINSIRKFK